MEDGQRDSTGKIYLSGIGHCVRQLAYKFNGVPAAGKEIDGRAKLIFFAGDVTELVLVSLAKLAGCVIFATGRDQINLSWQSEDEKRSSILGHPDGLILHEGKIGLVEVKSMSDFSFDRFEKGDIDSSYIWQVNAYMQMLGVDYCCFVGLNKNNGVLHEIVLKRDEVVCKAIGEKIRTVLKSTAEALPEPPPEYDFNPKTRLYPWQCSYCNFFKICRTNAELVVVRSAYKLKEKEAKIEAAK